MTKLEIMEEIRRSLVQLLETKGRLSDDDVAYNEFLSEYETLVDRFCSEDSDMLAPAQCRAAKEDVEYFSQLIILACSFYADSDPGGKESTH